MNHMKLCRLVGASLLVLSLSAFSQQQEPAPTPPPADQSAAMKEAVRNFLAIGAPPNPEAVKRGQALFVPTCGFCHGTNAGGGNGGPDLVRSVLVLHDKGTGKEITPVILNGSPGTAMPAFKLTNAQIQDLAAFLLSRNQAAANRMEYKLLNIVTGDPKAGETYFTAHCASCHSPTGDLAHIAGKMDPPALQSRFLYPKSQTFFGPGVPENPRSQVTATVTLASGQSFTGRLNRIDDFSVALTDQAGPHIWQFESEPGIKVQVNNPLQPHIDLLKQYTDADMHNILAYLETLK